MQWQNVNNPIIYFYKTLSDGTIQKETAINSILTIRGWDRSPQGETKSQTETQFINLATDY